MSSQKRTSLDFQGFSPVQSKNVFFKFINIFNNAEIFPGAKEIKSPKLEDVTILSLICKQLLEWHDKWKLAQKRGYSLCLSIENQLKRSFQSSEGNQNHYSQELLKLCDDLRIITSVFEDLVQNVKKAKNRLEIFKNSSKDDIVLRSSYTIDDLLRNFNDIQIAYVKEYETKKTITGTRD